MWQNLSREETIQIALLQKNKLHGYLLLEEMVELRRVTEEMERASELEQTREG